jgi:hypothetical protein
MRCLRDANAVAPAREDTTPAGIAAANRDRGIKTQPDPKAAAQSRMSPQHSAAAAVDEDRRASQPP